MERYHPFTFKIRQHKSADRGDAQPEITELPEREILDALPQMEPEDHWLLFLGGPGAGKSTLFNNWFLRLSEHLSDRRLGMRVPVLVRFAALRDKDFELDSDELADRLWDIGVEDRALTSKANKKVYSKKSRKLFTPIWLLDGLDEVPPKYLDESLFSKLANLYGCVNITCRTGVYENIRRTADPYKEKEYELLDLKPGREQIQFLTMCMAGDKESATSLYQKLRGNDQLRVLAGIPMMLRFMADTAAPLDTSYTRSTFYEEALNQMWHRKLSGEPDMLYLITERDSGLKTLSERMQLERAEAPLSWFMQAMKEAGDNKSQLLVDGIRLSGIVRLDERRGRFQFRHLTFQEYYLAQVWAGGNFDELLRQYWNDSRYENCLALAIELLHNEGRIDEITEAMNNLVQWAEETHASDPSILWAGNRSPTRIVLHLIQRASLPLGELDPLDKMIESLFLKNANRIISATMDPLTPPVILAFIANADAPVVQAMVAENPVAPSETLVALATSDNSMVVKAVAGNSGTPPQVLLEIAQKQDQEIYQALASNPSTPETLLEEFAKIPALQGTLVFNPSTPESALKRVAIDINQRLAEVGNPLEPSNTVEALARTVQEMAAVYGLKNSCLDRAFLEQTMNAPFASGMLSQKTNSRFSDFQPWAHLEEDWARKAAASNEETPAEILLQLATDENKEVRIDLAKNPTAPAQALAILSKDPDQSVSLEAMKNPAIFYEDI